MEELSFNNEKSTTDLVEIPLKDNRLLNEIFGRAGLSRKFNMRDIISTERKQIKFDEVANQIEIPFRLAEKPNFQLVIAKPVSGDIKLFYLLAGKGGNPPNSLGIIEKNNFGDILNKVKKIKTDADLDGLLKTIIENTDFSQK
jgi:hypothetical protein